MGSREGALKARDTNLAKDPDHYKKLARRGGAASSNRTFRDPVKARLAGIKSGQARREKKGLQMNKHQRNIKVEFKD